MRRTLVFITPPSAEPVTLEEALTQCHANAGIEDAWFTACIAAGRRKAEGYLRRSLMTQKWALRYDGGAPGVVELPRSPVQEVTFIVVDGKVLELDGITINTEGSPARIIMPVTVVDTLRVEYTAGYGDNAQDVPEDIRAAILLYVAHNYGNREGERELPNAFYNLLAPYRLFL